MNTERQIRVGGLKVTVVHKAIKNLHLGVYPPDGRVRVAAPRALSDEAVRLAVVDKLVWIKRQQASFKSQPRQGQREMIDLESHYFQGQRYLLKVIPTRGAAHIELRPNTLELHTREDSNPAARERVLREWYRVQIRQIAAPLIEQWTAQLDVELAQWNIRRMKTRWGSCDVANRRIWLNLELAKKPLPCLEYVIVHELLHLIERGHNDQFVALFDEHLPQWRARRDELNAMPLAHESWEGDVADWRGCETGVEDPTV